MVSKIGDEILAAICENQPVQDNFSFFFLNGDKTSLLTRVLSTRDLYKKSNKEEIIGGVLGDQEAHLDISTRLTPVLPQAFTIIYSLSQN